MSEKSEAPSQRKLKDARRKGQVSKSQEIVSIGTLLITVIAIKAIGPALWHNMGDQLREGLSASSKQELTPAAALEIGREAGQRALLILAPLLATVALAGVVLNVGQTGLLLSAAGLKPKFNNINPATGFKRIVSVQGLINLAKAFGKMGIIALTVGMTLRSQLQEIALFTQFTPGEAAGKLGALAFDVAIRAAAVLFILAIGDYAWQRRKFFRDLMMTKEELKQELKENDGDPQIKAAIRRRRQQLMSRMMAAVPHADVVVTNPTHFAVALKYDPVSMAAPVVVAKGQDLLAKRIKEVARKAGVPVLEEPSLARALHAAVPIGHPVPANLFRAVAEVLAWVYALRAKKAPFSRRSTLGPQAT